VSGDSQILTLSGEEIESIKYLAKMWAVAQAHASAKTDAEKALVDVEIMNVTGRLLILRDTIQLLAFKIENLDKGT